MCVLRATELPIKKKKGPRSKVGAARGMAEGEKAKLSKEIGPVTQEILVETVIEQHVQNANASIREQLQQTLQEFKDVFPY